MCRRGVGLLVGVTLAAVACGGPGAGNDEGARHHVAFLRAVPNPTSQTEPAILAELRRAGFVQGANLLVFGREGEEAYPEPEAAAEAVRRWQREGVEIVFALSTSGAEAARLAAPDASVLFLSNDPLAAGLVADEAAPEGNLTGVTFRVPADRTLDIARRAIPGLQRVGLAYPPDDPAAIPNRDAFTAAAEAMGLEILTEPFAAAEEAPAAVERLAARGVEALLMSTSPTATRAMSVFEDAADAHGLPVVANTDVIGFALVIVHPDGAELGRQLGRQAVRLLRGAEPGSIPVEDPRRFRVVLDEAVAVRLGISLPEALVMEADLVRR